MLAADIIKLLDAGYSKEEIEKMEAAETVTAQEEPEKDETPTELDTKKEEAVAPTPDPLDSYKNQIAEINKELQEATKEIQKFNVSMRQQPEVQKEDASDILYNVVANVIPPEK